MPNGMMRSRDMDRELRGRRGDDVLNMVEDMQNTDFNARVRPPELPELSMEPGPGMGPRIRQPELEAAPATGPAANRVAKRAAMQQELDAKRAENDARRRAMEEERMRRHGRQMDTEGY